MPQTTNEVFNTASGVGHQDQGHGSSVDSSAVSINGMQGPSPERDQLRRAAAQRAIAAKDRAAAQSREAMVGLDEEQDRRAKRERVVEESQLRAGKVLQHTPSAEYGLAQKAQSSSQSQAGSPPSHSQSTAPKEKRGWFGAIGSAAYSVGNFLAETTGIKGIYEGVKEGDIKKVAIGSLQLAGTGLALCTGASLGVLAAGAVLQNAGSIVSALSAGSPAAIAGAALGVGLSVVVGKYGNVVAHKIMTKIAPIAQEVLQSGLLTVGEGIGKRIGGDIIKDIGADKLMKLGLDCADRAAKAFGEQLENFAGPAVEAAKREFGAAALQVKEVACEKIRELASKVLTPELESLFTKLGVTDRVAAVTSQDLFQQAANAGILGQFGFGGGKVLSYFGMGNSGLRAAIKAYAPDMADAEVKQLAKHLCRAVQQGESMEIVKESLSGGITKGLCESLADVLEKPMKDRFVKGVGPSIKQFAQRHGIEHFEKEMVEAAGLGFDDAYGAVLAKHVRAGVEKALNQEERRGGAGSRKPHEDERETKESVAESLKLKVDDERAVRGNDPTSEQGMVKTQVIARSDGSIETVTLVYDPANNRWSQVASSVTARVAEAERREAEAGVKSLAV